MPLNLAAVLSSAACLQCLSAEQLKIARLWSLAAYINSGRNSIGFDPRSWTADPRFNCIQCSNIPILTTWLYGQLIEALDIGPAVNPLTVTPSGCLTCLTEYQLELAKTILLGQLIGYEPSFSDPTNGNSCLNCATAYNLDLLEAYLITRIYEGFSGTTLNAQQVMDLMACLVCLTSFQLLTLQVQMLAQ